ASPALKLVVTSRIPLGIRAEQQFALAPLALPDLGAGPRAIAQSPAVQLFVERAQAVRPGFQLTAEHAAAVGAICSRVDGLPLAIELIAARAKMLPPADLLRELEHGLAALAHGWRDLPERQRTLRHALGWSFSLLGSEEQHVFGRLGVFAGDLRP